MIYISKEVKAVYSVICAILHTGNIDFDEKETTDHKGDACVITNMDLVNTSKCTDLCVVVLPVLWLFLLRFLSRFEFNVLIL